MHPIRQLIRLVEGAIKEAPINDLSVHNMDQPGSFPDVDRKLMTNPAHIQKIRKRFEKTPYVFHLTFVNLPGKKFVDKHPPEWGGESYFTDDWRDLVDEHEGVTTPETLKSLFGIKVGGDPGAISVVYISNANVDGTVPLTPWIIAHRFAHALLDHVDKCPSDLSVPIEDFLRAARDVNQRDMTMRSARTNTLVGREFRVEFVAQFLMTGAVTLSSGSQLSDSPEIEALYKQNVLDPAQTKINALLKEILDRCVGKLFLAV